MSDEGMEAARAFAQWHLGDPDWADLILEATRVPDSTWARLASQGMQRAQERLRKEKAA